MDASIVAVIDTENLAKIRALLAAGTSDGVSLGLALLESLGATAADFDAALVPPGGEAVAAVADRWFQGDAHGRIEYDRYHRLVVAPRFYRDREADRQAGRPFLDLVEIPAGEFEMGSKRDTDFDDQKPAHRVRITRPFLLGKTTVTQGQWWSVMGTRPWHGQDRVTEGADVAATYILWDGAVAFCQRLTELEQSAGRLRGNQRYRLPTEAEWEYACRAGTTTRFSFGDDEAGMKRYAWFRANTQKKGKHYAHRVARKKPNPWGLHDMHGNVFEWCSDWHGEDYYARSPVADPECHDAGQFRVLRGGSWACAPESCHSAFRYRCSTPFTSNSDGFRVVCEVA